LSEVDQFAQIWHGRKNRPTNRGRPTRRLHAGCPLGQSQCIPQADSRRSGNPPGFGHRPNPAFDTSISGSLALALSQSYLPKSRFRLFRNVHHHRFFGQQQLAVALRSTPDCRPRRAFLHLSYSYAAPCGPALLVTQCHKPTYAVQQIGCYSITSSGRGPSSIGGYQGRAPWLS